MRVIAGSARSLQLVTVPGKDTRPTTDKYKETLFNILQPRIPGCRFLDLFAGSGAIGIEALSRGAREAVFVESSRRAVTCIRQNLVHTRLEERGRVFPQDVMAAISRLEREDAPFDIIFLDPPYREEYYQKVITLLARTVLMNEQTLLVAEAPLEEDFSWIGNLALEEIRRKEYKTNQHIFLRRKANENGSH